MRNLQLLNLHYINIGELFEHAQHFTQITDNNINQSILTNYLYFIKNNKLYELEIDNSDVKQQENDRNNTIEPIINIEFIDVIAIKILPIECHIHIVTKHYLYILDRTELNQCLLQHKIEFKHEIIIANWSPIDDILITCTINGDVTVIPLNGIYDIEYQSNSHVDDQIPDTVYVGWGSETTQFRGSEGKLKIVQNQQQSNRIIDKSPTISWRGNGELFAINHYKNNQRYITIFDKNGKPQYRTDMYPDLQTIITWRPNGNMLVAIAKNNSNKNQFDCVIFEKNGQKRCNFPVDCDQDDSVLEMKWSPCSRILAILTGNQQTNNKILHLLTTTNYQWYKKQQLIFKSTNQLLNFEFLQQSNVFLLRLITQKQIIVYKFYEMIDRNNDGICGVINGNSIQLTDFKQAIIPPPLYSIRITTEKSVNLLKISDDSTKIALINCTNSLQIYTLINQKLLFEYDLNTFNHIEIPSNFYNLQWLNDDQLIFRGNFGQHSTIYICNCSTNQLEILNDYNCAIGNLMKCELIDDSIYVFEQIHTNCVLLKHDLDIVEFSNGFLLTSMDIFEYAGRKIADNVNSFIIFNNYVLFTTKLQQLFCMNLFDLDTNLLCCRSIEQGARIVCCIPNTSLIVFQLPRGNLETISCRTLAIDILDDFLQTNQWRNALNLIKTEKLNTNLLYDLNPERFCTNIEKFVKSIEQTTELTRICLEFDNNNCLNTIYKDFHHKNAQKIINSNKIQMIFHELFIYFDTIDYIEYLSMIVVVNYHFFTLKDGLIYLQDGYHQFIDTNDVGIEGKLKESVQNLRHYGCDDLQLFNTTLSLYDLDLSRFIINCLQIDPRYYQQQIDKFSNLNEYEKRYRINCYLKQPQIAINYLIKSNNLIQTNDELIDFIQTNNLYRKAYQICNLNSKYSQLITNLYANHLNLNHSYQLAGIILKRAKLYKEALKQFRLALDWRNSLELCDKIDLNQQEKFDLINDLCCDLIRNHQYKDVIYLYENHLNNPQLLIDILIKNTQWLDALFLIKKYNSNEQLINDFLPNLLQYKSMINDKLNELYVNFTNYTQRLNDVRLRNVEKFHVISDDLNDFDDLYSDVSSVTTTTRSNRTHTSTQSSKNRRKDARKRQDLRPGGIYEDIALIRALFNLIEQFYDKRNDVKDCCLLLLQEYHNVDYDDLKGFYQFYMRFYQLIQNSIHAIWPNCFYQCNSNNQQQQQQRFSDKELVDLKNLEFLDVKFRVPPLNPGELKIDLFN